MTSIAGAATGHLLELMKAPTGVGATLQALGAEHGLDHLPAVRTIAVQNAASDLAERTLQGKYPAILIYCEKLANKLKEKFRVFSGVARVCIEVRCSHDRLEGLEQQLQLYTGAVCQVLDQERGEWTQGLYFAGEYEVTYSPVRTGGNYFLQTAKVVLEVEVSR